MPGQLFPYAWNSPFMIRKSASPDSGAGRSQPGEALPDHCAYVDHAQEAPARQEEARRCAVIALAGNPNSGKTSIFNRLTGLNQHVANFPGVTVERKEGAFRAGSWELKLVDLPGTYSLTAYSMEEIVARDFLVEERPDLVVAVLDASNLQRNLYLATQLVELGLPVILAANMMDVARRRGHEVDLEELSRQLGLPVIGLVGHLGQGLRQLTGEILELLEAPATTGPRLVDYGTAVEDAIGQLAGLYSSAVEFGSKTGHPSALARWIALRLLEGDQHVRDRLKKQLGDHHELCEQASRLVSVLEEYGGMSVELQLAHRRHAWLAGVMEACRRKSPEPGRQFRSDITDRVLLNRWLGLPIFLGLMYLTFQLTFTLGAAPMSWLESLFSWLAGSIDTHWPLAPDSPLKSLILDGIIGGVGGVLIFLPNIVLLFLCLTLMEDSGYMARAAFLMDRLMSRIGLHGKSFIPLLTGFGCSIPGIMGTRVLENERDRLLTMLVLPLMSCGARLPIYLLLIPAFFPASIHAEMLFVIYAVGVLLAVGMAKLLRVSVLKGEQTPFVMELPPYKFPTLRSIWSQIRMRSWLYLRKAGTLILGVSMLLWAMAKWPAASENSELEARLAAAEALGDQAGIQQVENLQAEHQLEESLLGRMGKFIEPVMAPMGFDWKISTSLIGAFAAKEVFVAQMGVVYALGETDEGSESLRQALRSRYSPLVGFCVMLFALIATPCMSTFAVTRRESGSTRWAVFQLASLTMLAWLLCVVVYQAGALLGIA
jgi:ferrous iron transport protein B